MGPKMLNKILIGIGRRVYMFCVYARLALVSIISPDDANTYIYNAVKTAQEEADNEERQR